MYLSTYVINRCRVKKQFINVINKKGKLTDNNKFINVP